MTYTPNTPQGFQQIAATRPIINANFQFISNSIGQEHNFNTADATQTYHKQASMPNQATPGALPTGTNGIYYVQGSTPHFYNTVDYQLAYGTRPFITQVNTPVTLTTSFQNILTLAANSSGVFYIWTTGVNGAISIYATGRFMTGNNGGILINPNSEDGIIATQLSGLIIQAKVSSGTAAVSGIINYSLP